VLVSGKISPLKIGLAVLVSIILVGENQVCANQEPTMLKTVWEWIKWLKDVITKSILVVMGLSLSGVVAYFVIKFLLKQLWNISDDITDNIGDMMDE
jgi:hypothetical protein